MNDIRELGAYEEAALASFAAAHGRYWKRELRDVYWYNARIWRDASGSGGKGEALQGLRNDPHWGHGGLQAYKLKS